MSLLPGVFGKGVIFANVDLRVCVCVCVCKQTYIVLTQGMFYHSVAYQR